jgi:hypothetical protein
VLHFYSSDSLLQQPFLFCNFGSADVYFVNKISMKLIDILLNRIKIVRVGGRVNQYIYIFCGINERVQVILAGRVRCGATVLVDRTNQGAEQRLFTGMVDLREQFLQDVAEIRIPYKDNCLSNHLPYLLRREFSMTWTQNYDPFGFWPVSDDRRGAAGADTLLRAGRAEEAGVVSAMWGMLMAVLLALLVFRMPALMVGAAAVHGVIFRVSADRVDHHRLDVSVQYRGRDRAVSGHEGFDRQSLLGQAAAADPDRLLFRGVSGGDGRRRAPVAIAGAFLIGLGFNPFQAATLCLLANYGAGGLGRSREPAADSLRGDGAG